MRNQMGTFGVATGVVLLTEVFRGGNKLSFSLRAADRWKRLSLCCINVPGC